LIVTSRRCTSARLKPEKGTDVGRNLEEEYECLIETRKKARTTNYNRHNLLDPEHPIRITYVILELIRAPRLSPSETVHLLEQKLSGFCRPLLTQNHLSMASLVPAAKVIPADFNYEE